MHSGEDTQVGCVHSWENNVSICTPLVIFDNIKAPSEESDFLAPEVTELMLAGKLEREQSYMTLKAWEQALHTLGKSLAMFKVPENYCLRPVAHGEKRLKDITQNHSDKPKDMQATPIITNLFAPRISLDQGMSSTMRRPSRQLQSCHQENMIPTC